MGSKDASPTSDGMSRRGSLQSADRILIMGGQRHSTLDLLFTPADVVLVVPPADVSSRMASESGLDIEEIRDIVEIFKKFDEDNGSCGLDMVHFEGALAAIFQIEEGYKIMPGPLAVAWEGAQKEGFEGFISWYSFARFNTNIAQPSALAGGLNSAFSIENLAAEYDVPVNEIARVKKKFDEFDADG